MATAEVERMLTLVPKLLDIPHRRMWVVYDEEADIYHFSMPGLLSGKIFCCNAGICMGWRRDYGF